MNCPNCNTPNEAGAKFCRNCGTELVTAKPANKDHIYLLTIIGWEYLQTLFWTVFRKWILPNCCKVDDVTDYDLISRIYKITGWVTDAITIIMLVAFAAMARNNVVKILLVLFAVFRIALALADRAF